jgi:hypothetical protein
MRDKLLTYLFMIIAVPIAGELKFYPFDGSDIRVAWEHLFFSSFCYGHAKVILLWPVF